jgi:putative FmdB family regulatory protein
MIYQYQCNTCHMDFELTIPASEYNDPAGCPKCFGNGIKLFTPFLFSGSRPQHAEYNPAFGKVIKNSYHRKEEAKKRDWIEIGNEKVHNIENDFARAREDKWKRSWAEV